MDARTLYRQGVVAIRDHHDIRLGRELLIQSIQLDPQNDMAWLWLTRTIQDSQKQLEYVERALQANPHNETARQLKERLKTRPAPAVIVPLSAADAAGPAQPKTVDMPVSQAEKDHVARLMDRADIYRESGKIEAAIAQWQAVLDIRVDHETALRHVTGQLWRQRRWDEAWQIVRRAIDAGTTIPTIYMTAIDMAEQQGEYAEAEALCDHAITMPTADDQLYVAIADFYAGRFKLEQARQFLEHAHQAHPDSQKILLKLGDLLEELDRHQEAMTYYDQAVRVGSHTAEGKNADRKLARFVPILTDRERGSLWLALRETLGIGVFYLMLAWQDAGLNLLQIRLYHWAGVCLGLLGGHLLITATSSPQQQPLAEWLGGDVPPDRPDQNPDVPGHMEPGRAVQEPTHLPIIPEEARYLLGFAGVVVLLMAFWLVFHRSIVQVIDHPLPYLP